MKNIFQLLKPYKKQLIISAITNAIGVFLLLCMPYVMSSIVDNGIAENDYNAVIISSAIMLALSVISLVSSLIASKNNAKLTTGFTGDLFKLTFHKINDLSYQQYTKIGPSGLLTRVTDDIYNMEGVASMLVYTFVSVPILFIGSTVLAFLADAILATIFMLSIPPIMLIVFFIMKPLQNMWETSDHYVDEQNKIVRERLSGLRVIRAFNNEDKEHARAKFATEEMSKYIIKANVRAGFIDPIAMLLLNVATVVIVAVCGFRAQNELVSKAGDIVAIIQYVALISNALINLTWTIAWLPRLKVSVNRINEVLTMPKEDVDVIEENADDKTEDYDIKLENVCFAYPNAKEYSLKNISLNVKEGEKIAIIGGTGSGKSTLIKLLLGLFDVSDGNMYIGKKNYRNMDKRTIRSKFSAALQKPMIFEGTIADNIKMGNPDATDEEIIKALDDCCMKEFLESKPEGLNYFLISGGQNVSGGQKQRLNMTRTIIKPADVYVFDDSFSALDFLTESIIKKNLAVRLAGKTQIIITQRVSTAITAERIFVLDKGKIVNEGTHEELIKSSDIYREICISQLGKDSVKEANA